MLFRSPSASVAEIVCENALLIVAAFNVVDVTQTGTAPAVIEFNEVAVNPVLGFVIITSYGASVGLNVSGRAAIIDVADPLTVVLAFTSVASSDFLNLTSTFVAKFVPVIVVVSLTFGSPLGVISVIVGGAQYASVLVARVDAGFNVNVIASLASAFTVVTYRKGAEAVIVFAPAAAVPTFAPADEPK